MNLLKHLISIAIACLIGVSATAIAQPAKSQPKSGMRSRRSRAAASGAGRSVHEGARCHIGGVRGTWADAPRTDFRIDLERHDRHAKWCRSNTTLEGHLHEALETFWRNIDPTQANGQSVTRARNIEARSSGTRRAEKKIAEASKAALDKSKRQGADRDRADGGKATFTRAEEYTRISTRRIRSGTRFIRRVAAARRRSRPSGAAQEAEPLPDGHARKFPLAN